MSNGKALIIHLIARLIKKIECDSIAISLIAISWYKNESIFS